MLEINTVPPVPLIALLNPAVPLPPQVALLAFIADHTSVDEPPALTLAGVAVASIESIGPIVAGTFEIGIDDDELLFDDEPPLEVFACVAVAEGVGVGVVVCATVGAVVGVCGSE